MVTVGARLKALRDSIGLSQQKLGALCGLQQAAVNRYETDHSATPFRILLWYADYFNVSLDYIFGRTDHPNGKAYNFQPEQVKLRQIDPEQMKLFVQACFEPGSEMNEQFKKLMLSMTDLSAESTAKSVQEDKSGKK